MLGHLDITDEVEVHYADGYLHFWGSSAYSIHLTDENVKPFSNFLKQCASPNFDFAEISLGGINFMAQSDGSETDKTINLYIDVSPTRNVFVIAVEKVMTFATYMECLEV